MHNVQMIGVQHLDRFSLRGCFLVIGAFGIVTLISYFNELAKAGLLSGHPHLQLIADHTTRRSLEEGGMLPAQDPVILQKDGGFHHLDLNLLPLHRTARNESDGKASEDKGGQEDEAIQISLHLAKDDNYVQKNKSTTKIYQFHNTMPNFFLTLNESLHQVIMKTENFSVAGQSLIRNFTSNVLHQKIKSYRNRTKVLLYQHEPGGYAVRDCYLARSIERKLVFAQAPLNAIYRRNWEMMSREQKEKFEILYGGLSFGTCESMSKECSYVAMIRHPLDRLLQAYSICSGDSNRTMCSFLKIDNMTSIHQFLEHHGSSFFQKLLYYSRHCRLVGQDEVCIHDNKVYFVLSRQEKEEYLKEILNNVEQWFSVVGLMEELKTSLSLMQTVTGLNFTHCDSTQHQVPPGFFRIFPKFHRFDYIDQANINSLFIDGVPYDKMRTSLLENPDVQNYLSADIAIYDKFVQVFRRQFSVYSDLKRLMVRYFPPSLNSQDSQIVKQGINATTVDKRSAHCNGSMPNCTNPVNNVQLVNESRTLEANASRSTIILAQAGQQNSINVTSPPVNVSSVVISNNKTDNPVGQNRSVAQESTINVEPIDEVIDNALDTNSTELIKKRQLNKKKVDKINQPLLNKYNVFKRQKKREHLSTNSATHVEQNASHVERLERDANVSQVAVH